MGIVVYYIQKADDEYIVYTTDIRYCNREGLIKRKLEKEEIGNAMERIVNILRQLDTEVLFKWIQ